MNLQSIVFYNCILIFRCILSSVCVGMVLLKKVSYYERKHVFGRILILMLCIIFTSALAAVLYKMGMFQSLAVSSLLPYIVYGVNTFVIWLFFREQLQVCWNIVVLNGLISDVAEMLAFSMSSKDQFNISILGERYEYIFRSLVMGSVILALVLLILYKMKAGARYNQWMEHRDIWIWGTFFLSVYPVVQMLVGSWLHSRGLGGVDSSQVSIIMMLGVLITFYYVGREEQQRKRLEEQQLNIQQQNTYIEALEGMQEEVRRFRHDYKNMMAGICLQAQEADFARISEFIQEMTEDFDSQIGGEIQRMSQLQNVCMTELKALLFTKLKKMQNRGISCELEVINPFYETRFKTTDLCRCLGILIDNAMEEVDGQETAKVYIMISSQKEYTTFRVKNALYHKIDFYKIWQNGYSTKGNERGIGLASYKKILENYDNALPVTAVQDGYFIQELKVKN